MDSSESEREDKNSNWTRWVGRVKDILCFAIGAAGAAYQLFFADPVNPALFPIIAGLLGAPFAMAIDQKRRENAAAKSQ